VLLAAVVLGAVLAAPASSGDGISMRRVPYVCVPFCAGDRQPVWSPDGKTIALVRYGLTENVSRGQIIWAVPAAGGPARPLLNPRKGLPSGPFEGIAWSPDGTRLAFQAGSWANYVFRIDAAKAIFIRPPSTTGTGSLADRPPVWSPDGRSIAFVRYGYSGRYEPPGGDWCCQLWVAAADGSGATSIGGGRPPGEWLAEPAWSPDGRLAYVTGPRDDSGEPDLARAEIWLVNADGSGRRRLVADSSDGGFHDLTWWPDGSRLSYVAELSGYDPHRLRWVSLDGAQGELTAIRAGYKAACCDFAPDGRKAAYTREGDDGAAEVRVVGEGLRDTWLADGVSAQSKPWLTTTSWAPDGKRLAYVSDGDCPTLPGVYTVRLDRTARARVTKRCRINGNRGPNRLHGNDRPNALYGGAGRDVLLGYERPDFLQGGAGRDTLFGGPGDDRLYGGPGADRILGGPNWDAIYARDGARDVVRCGTGQDAVRADRGDRIARDCELVERG
jgi:Tol biopolymer transport system component